MGNAKDVLKTNGQEDLFNNIELPITVLADMEYHGFKIDKQRLHEYGVVLSNRIKTLENNFHVSREEFNINSKTAW